MEKKPTYYTIIPAVVRFDNNITPFARLVFSDILHLSKNDNGYCYIGSSKLAGWYGVNRATISKAIKQLEKKKYIKVVRKRKKNMHQKNLIWVLPKSTSDVPKVNMGCCENAQSVVPKVNSKNTSNKNTSKRIESVQKFIPRKAYDEKTGTFVGNGMMDYLKQQGIMKEG